jgi:hypothetical protein
VLVTGQKVFHGLGEGALAIHQAAVTQPHDKEAEASARVPASDRAERAPIGLGALAGSKGQLAKGGLAPGSHAAYVGFDNGIAAIKAVFAQALEDLRGALRILFQHLDNRGLEWIKFAGPWTGFSRPEPLLTQPVGDSAGIEAESGGNLRHLESLVVMQVFDVAKLMRIDPANTSQICCNTALMSTVSSWAWRRADSARSCASRAKTWESGRR